LGILANCFSHNNVSGKATEVDCRHMGIFPFVEAHAPQRWC
jgi:hypothetical protein